MTVKYKIQSAIVVFCMLLGGVAMAAAEPVNTTPQSNNAAPEDPIKMLKSITDNVLQALRKNEAELDANPKKIYPLVDKYILPYVDFNEMSLWVAGRTAWGKATDNTKESFISAFKVLVVRTYATALNNYTNESVYFAPQKINTNKDRIQVSSTILRKNKENIKLNYRLVKHENSWLVYDIIIEGVSILQGFQAQFTDEIRQKGLEKVIAQIEEHNNKTSG